MSLIETFSLVNGLAVLAEEVPHAKALSFAFLFPAGSARDPEGGAGCLTVLDEVLFRAAGSYDAEAFISRIDSLGLLRSSDAARDAYHHSCALDTEVFEEAMEIYRLAFDEPRITKEDLEAGQALALSALERLEDEPTQRAVHETANRHLPAPLDRSPMGLREEIETLSCEGLAADARRRLRPAGAYLAVTGPISSGRVREVLERRLAPWTGETLPLAEAATRKPPSENRIPSPSAQTQITLVSEWIPPDDPDEPKAVLATQVLSGGMGSRLFVEVREKRGLVYSVWASLQALRGRLDLYAYAGTMPAREAETREVLEKEIRRISEGVTEAEFERALFGIRSRLAMDSESVAGRSLRLLVDLFRRGRARTFEERESEFLRVKREDLNRFLAERPLGAFTRLRLGPDSAPEISGAPA